MKKKAIQKTLPPIDNLLYKDIYSFVHENYGNLEKFNQKLLVNKIAYIIDGLILKLYGQPIFDAIFIPMENGPVEASFYDIQYKSKKLSTTMTLKRRKILDDDLNTYKRMTENVFNAFKNAVEKKVIKLNPSEISELTHTPEWEKKYYQYARENDTKKKHNIKMTDKDILKFLTSSLSKKYPKFLPFIEKYIDGI